MEHDKVVVRLDDDTNMFWDATIVDKDVASSVERAMEGMRLENIRLLAERDAMRKTGICKIGDTAVKIADVADYV